MSLINFTKMLILLFVCNILFLLKRKLDCRIHTLLTCWCGVKDYFIQISVVFFWQPFFFSFRLSFLLSLLLWPQLFPALLSLWQLFVFVYPCTFSFFWSHVFYLFFFLLLFFDLFLKASFFFFCSISATSCLLSSCPSST